MNNIFEFIIDEKNKGIRIDVFLSFKIENLSRNYIQKLISNKKILLNGKETKANYKLKLGDKVNIFIETPKPLKIEGENIPLDIMYEDDDIIIINKKQGMVVHPSIGHCSGTVVNALIYHCGSSLSGINGIIRPGIVHRIDKDTSGVIVIAKNDNSHRCLAEQLYKHSMRRVYNAIVLNNIKEDSMTIDLPIGRHPKDRKKMAVTYKNSKKAITHIKVLKRYYKYTFIEAKLETGRTHQIRVHMAYKSHPLLGDKLYGNGKELLNVEGQVLHARILGFIHPRTKKYMEFVSKLPNYFENLLNKFENNYYR